MKRIFSILLCLVALRCGATSYYGAFFGNGGGLTNVNGGWWSNVTVTVATPNTNQLWVSGAGTAGFNSTKAYSLMQGAPSFGSITSYAYTNIVGPTTTNWIIASFGVQVAGSGDNFDQKTFYMGTTTNNQSTGSASAPNVYAYFSSPAINAYWTNGDDIFGTGSGSGINPPPVVNFGTNMVQVAEPVYFAPNFYANAFTNGVIYVATNGNDVLASNLQCAFQTCQAAKRFALSGDTIKVQPGIYYDHDLLKNGVDWQFDNGTLLAWDQSQIDPVPRAIFDDYVGAVTSTITCDRIHYTTIVPVTLPVMLITNPATHINLTFNQEDNAEYIPGQAADQSLGFPGYPTTLQPGSGGAINIVETGYLDIKGSVMSGFTNAARMVLNINDGQGSGNPSYGQFQSIAPEDLGGVGWQGGETHVRVSSITATNQGPSSAFPGYAFVSGNPGSVETSCFLSADYINGFLYWDDSNPLARTWVDVNYVNAPPNLPALRYYGVGVHYYSGQKIAATQNGPVFDSTTVTANTYHLWIDVQKITQNGPGYWVNLSGGGSTWWHVLYFEDNSGNRMTGGIEAQGTGTNFFFGGDMVLSNAPAVTISGGQNTLQGMTITATGTNYPVELLGTSGSNNLTLQNCILNSSAAPFSVFGNSPNQFINGVFEANAAPTNTMHILGTNYYHAQVPL
jgi:hypothetical protein